MRSRKEIKQLYEKDHDISTLNSLVLELLLDIRDLINVQVIREYGEGQIE